MAYARTGVLRGRDVTLKMVIEDDEGNLVDPDALPSIYIYDESFETEDIDAEIEAGVYTGLGPYVPTKISTGYYEYTYTVPSDAEEGTWYDLWVCQQGGVDSSDYFDFEVIKGSVLRLQKVQNNTLIVVELESSIADLDGNTLGVMDSISFSTEYSPLYASADLVRAEVGMWIDSIPTDTLHLLIHWASKEADMITPRNFRTLKSYGVGDDVHMSYSSKGRNTDMYKFARTKFVVYDTAVRALTLPATATAGSVAGTNGVKRLGDLLIEEGMGGLGGRGLTLDQIQEMKRKRDEWWRVVNAGGHIMPGQSLEPSIASKGLADPDRRRSGRQWESSEDVYYAQPTTNGKYRRAGRRKFRHIFWG